jgi:hypothetical protein
MVGKPENTRQEIYEKIKIHALTKELSIVITYNEIHM